MMRAMNATIVLAGCVLAGCGGAAATTRSDPPASAQATVTVQTGGSAASEPETTTGDRPTQFQLSRLVGHYSTTDGTSGFIFDRSKTPYRARLDGAKEARELKERGAPNDYREFVSDDKSIWLRIDRESGEVLLFQGPKQHEGVDVVHDARADPL